MYTCFKEKKYMIFRCYAALGDVAKARFMKETFRIAEEVAKNTGGDGFNNYRVRARMAIMEKRFKEAESIYLEQVKIFIIILKI
jgi:intraflagellar transport protein 172